MRKIDEKMLLELINFIGNRATGTYVELQSILQSLEKLETLEQPNGDKKTKGV